MADPVGIIEIKEALAALCISIPGIKRADAMPPRTLEEVDTPCIAISAANEGAHTIEGPGVMLTRRVFNLEIYGPRISAGLDGELERQVEGLIETVVAFFAARPRINGLRGVRESKIISDSGVSVMLWNKTEFLGSVVALEIEYLQRVVYSNGN